MRIAYSVRVTLVWVTCVVWTVLGCPSDQLIGAVCHPKWVIAIHSQKINYIYKPSLCGERCGWRWKQIETFSPLIKTVFQKWWAFISLKQKYK